MNFKNSISAYQEALSLLPGGVNSPARAFKSVGTNPLFIAAAKGNRLTDIDGNVFIDYVASWGPMILGHAHEEVIAKITEVATKGTSFGAPTILETEMAKKICEMVPSIESVRMVNSGTEATMSALRLARGYTGRELVVKFEGCYHGHGDSFLIKAGSGLLTLGRPDSPGVTKGTASSTLLAPYNNLESLESLFAKHGNDIAAVILEPVTGNMGVIKPTHSFLQGLRELCTKHGTVLIFDEVMTGFRLSPGGAQAVMDVSPDLTTLGKIIGGGLPVGAYGGKKEIMECLAPIGAVYQAGTLSGNPLAMVAGLTTLNLLTATQGLYQALEERSAQLERGLQENLKESGVPGKINRVGSMMTLFFTDQEEVRNLEDVANCDTKRFAKYFTESLKRGIYYPPSQFEAFFVGTTHTAEDIEQTISVSREVMKTL